MSEAKTKKTTMLAGLAGPMAVAVRNETNTVMRMDWADGGRGSRRETDNQRMAKRRSIEDQVKIEDRTQI